VRTCWKALGAFRDVGDSLKRKYEMSVEISPRAVAAGANSAWPTLRGSSSSSRPSLRRREKRMRREPIRDTELVYVERSPNYCRENAARGSIGTWHVQVLLL